jgi:DNA-3-methyladenine glycosylase II
MRYRKPEFSTLVRSIVSQQVSTRAAATVYARLRKSAGGVRPKSILLMSEEELRDVGLSGQKRSYILDLAHKTQTRAVRFPSLAAMSDDQVIAQLTSIKGVGVWTAHMFLMFALRRPDVLPVGDLGIQNAIRAAYGLADTPKPADVERIGQPWRPWASVASWYLWRSIDGTAEI